MLSLGILSPNLEVLLIALKLGILEGSTLLSGITMESVKEVSFILDLERRETELSDFYGDSLGAYNRSLAVPSLLG